MTGLAGFLLAKTPGHSRRKPKDWYDITYVLLHNAAGGVDAAASAVLGKFGGELSRSAALSTDVRDNFTDTRTQGPVAYADEMVGNHPRP